MSTVASHAPRVCCPACSNPIETAWRHCGSCGRQLVHDDRAEEFRTVTLVVSDLQGSTALAEALDPESLRLVLDRYFDELGAVFESHGGRIEKRIGDAMVIAFGFPLSRDDDAVRALRATAEAQRTLANLNERLRIGWGVTLVNRTGVATGTMVYAGASGAHRVLAGEAMDLAGGLEPLAPPLEALVHNLEHGYTILWYDETIADDDAAMTTIRGIAEKFAGTSNFRFKFKAVPWLPSDEDGASFPDGQHVAFTHWSAGGAGETDVEKQQGVFQYCSDVSGAALETFMDEYPYLDSPEPNAG